MGCRRGASSAGITSGALAVLAVGLSVGLSVGLALAGARLAPGAQAAPASAAPDLLRVEVLSVRPHDPTAFTQGLLLHDGYLYESTGRGGGEARVREVDPLTGTAAREIYVPPDDQGRHYWGEGLARVGDRLVQLTYRAETALDYDIGSLTVQDRYAYEGEGWGLCHDGSRLVMSNGSDTLTFRHPDTFAVVGQITVTDDGEPRDRLNELECVGGLVYANIFMTDTIVAIDAQTGAVTARIDASGLLSYEERRSADVLNGIAFDPAANTFLLTGKYWPKLFEVRFVPGPTTSPTPTGTGTQPPTATVSPTATPGNPTPSASPTPTGPIGGPVYMPLALRLR